MDVLLSHTLPARVYSVIIYGALFVATWLPVSRVWAQEDPTRVESSVEYTFGDSMTYALTVYTSGILTEVELVVRYGQGASDVLTIDIPSPNPTPSFQARVVRDLKQDPLPAFSSLEYWWRITLLAGDARHHMETEHYIVEYLDNRFNWHIEQREKITIYWYDGDMDFGQMAADVASTALAEIAVDLDIELPANTSIYVYSTGDQLRAGAQVGGREWVGGHAYPDLGVALVAIRPGSGAYLDMRRAIPHELTHVLLYRLLGNGFASLPVWLNEGLAIRHQSDPIPAYDQILQAAYKKDALLDLSTLCSAFPLGGSDATLAYSQSGSVVDYIYARWGSAKLRELLLTYKDGATCTSGVQRALSIDLASMQTEWHADVLRAHPLGIAWRHGRSWLLLFVVPAMVIAALSLWPTRKQGPD